MWTRGTVRLWCPLRTYSTTRAPLCPKEHTWKAMTATMKPVFVDADMMLLRESGKPQGREPLELVLSRLPPESNEELKSGMELDDDYGA